MADLNLCWTASSQQPAEPTTVNQQLNFFEKNVLGELKEAQQLRPETHHFMYFMGYGMDSLKEESSRDELKLIMHKALADMK